MTTSQFHVYYDFYLQYFQLDSYLTTKFHSQSKAKSIASILAMENESRSARYASILPICGSL